MRQAVDGTTPATGKTCATSRTVFMNINKNIQIELRETVGYWAVGQAGDGATAPWDRRDSQSASGEDVSRVRASCSATTRTISSVRLLTPSLW